MGPTIAEYNEALEPGDQEICDLLAAEIDRGLPGADSKIWHAHPVWFLAGNPIVGVQPIDARHPVDVLDQLKF